MVWLYCSFVAIIGFALWGLFAKITLRDAAWAELTAMYGAALVVAGVTAALLGKQPSSWAPTTILFGILSSVSGALAVVGLYLALERSNVSVVIPLTALYPVLGALLAVAFLDERLGALQILGILLAAAGGVLIAAAA